MAHWVKSSKICRLFNVDICHNTVPFICFYIFGEIVADEENLMSVDILLYKIEEHIGLKFHVGLILTNVYMKIGKTTCTIQR